MPVRLGSFSHYQPASGNPHLRYLAQLGVERVIIAGSDSLGDCYLRALMQTAARES